MANFTTDSHFRQFAEKIDKNITQRKINFSSKEFLQLQKKQVDTLVALERRF